MISQKAFNQSNVAVWEKDFREPIQDTVVPHGVKSFFHVQEERGRLFTLAANTRSDSSADESATRSLSLIHI